MAVQVSFLIKSVKGERVVHPQHALLRLDDVGQGLQAYAVAKPAKKASDGRLHATISHASLEKQIGQQVLISYCKGHSYWLRFFVLLSATVHKLQQKWGLVRHSRNCSMDCNPMRRAILRLLAYHVVRIVS